jgi:ABC-type glycerol-3-phosphate transport system substrate-binding protein
MSKRKWFLLLTVLVIATQLLVACAPAAAPAPAEAPKPAAPEAPKAEAPAVEPAKPAAPAEAPKAEAPAEGPKKYDQIVVACWSGPEHDNLVKVAAEYEKATGNKVIVEEIARESYYDKLTTTFVGGGSDYDAAYVMDQWIPGWVKANALKEITSFVGDPKVASPDTDLKNFGAASDFFTIDSKLYALPSEGDTAWLWYRKDLLEEKGIKVPETWDEYREAAIKLNNPPKVYGTVIGAKPDEAWWDFQYYLFGMGGDVLDANKTPILNNEAGVKALTFYTDLLRKDKVVSPDVNTYGYNEILTSLQEGKAAMGIQWMAATADLTDCTKSPKVCKDGKPLLVYTLTPGIKQTDGSIKRHTGGSQWAWSIPTGSKNQEAAFKFIEWLTGKDGAKFWALNGGIPGNIKALSDADVVAKIPQFKMLAEVMPFRSIFPVLTTTPDMFTVVNEGVNASVSGAKDPKAEADDMVVKLTKILKDGGYLK